MPKARGFLVAALLVAVPTVVALAAPLGVDYPGPSCASCDAAGPPLEALVHGHFGRFFATQPVMGSVSLLLRAPFVALSYVGPHSLRWEYRLGSLACLLVLASLAWWLVRIMQRDGRRWAAWVLVAGICLAGPVTLSSLSWGHPEELVGGALCVAAVLFAGAGRPLTSGVVLGLALATKPWALLALLPAVSLARDKRGLLVLSAAAVAGILTVPMLLGDPARFLSVAHLARAPSAAATPPDIWWSYARRAGSPSGPGWMHDLAHPLVLGLATALTAAYWWARSTAHGRIRTADPSSALYLLALIMLLRCMFDPTDFSYYHAPFLIALLAAEAVGGRRWPYAASVSAAAIWTLTEVIAPRQGAGAFHAGYLIWAVPMTAYLALVVFAPDRLSGLRRSAVVTRSRLVTSG